MSDPRIIVALDFPNAEQALSLTAKLDPTWCRVKVGKELFTAAGPTLIEKLVRKGFEVFLDLKFHDIPSTVANACKAAAALGVWMMNVHALGGRRMLSAAREAVPPGSTKLIAVTLLTSMEQGDLDDIGLNGLLRLRRRAEGPARRSVQLSSGARTLLGVDPHCGESAGMEGADLAPAASPFPVIAGTSAGASDVRVSMSVRLLC